MPTAGRRVRRTQEQRTAATRARLLEATLESLSRVGWARTTTTEVAERAGVSRGAQLHHFPTKADLVTSAVEYVFQRCHDEFRRSFAKLPSSSARGSAAVDLLWTFFSGRTFDAWLELVVAARTDTALRRQVQRLGEQLVEMVMSTFRELFPPPSGHDSLYEIAPAFGFAVLQGLALERVAVANSQRRQMVLVALKRLAALALPQQSA
jgi:AcrR family transcriptional regulator